MTRLELRVSLDAISHNARAIRKALAPDTKLMAALKADAYGHGAPDVAKCLSARGLADAFAVATAEEGAQLRDAGVNAPILVLNQPMDAEQAELAVRRALCSAVFDGAGLELIDRAAEKLGVRANAHIKLDTGMARIGVRAPGELDKLLDIWTRAGRVRMIGAFTHFCAADTDAEYTRAQDTHFRAALARIRARGFSPICHAAASSAMLSREYQYDMARAGIALYGTGAGALNSELMYAQTLITRPVRLTWIDAGETVGYGRAFTAPRRTRVMTLPCGYGDGYPRALSGRADVLVNGARARLIGNICMDMMMADVTDAGDINAGSQVVLMGAQGGERITPDELSLHAQTIPYEIMLGFSPRVKRSVV